MTTIKAFNGLRPVDSLASSVASLPYDVMNTEEARVKIEENPLSFLRVTKSEATMPENTDPYSDEVYAKAAENLADFIEKGQMKEDDKPCLYIYRQRMDRHIQIGIVFCASVEEYRKGIIKKHELTRMDKEEDRVKHVKTCKAQTGPVFLTYKQRREIDAYILELMGNKHPACDFIADDGVRNTVYVIDSPLEIREIQKMFEQVPAFYIADGHHRCASALRVSDMLAEDPSASEEDVKRSKYFLAVAFPDNMMNIMDYNRLVKDLAGNSEEEFLQAVAEDFEIKECERTFKPAARHAFGMYLKGKWYALKAKEGSFAADDPVASLDVAILQDNLLAPVLKIGEPRTDKRIDFVGGIRGTEELVKRVDSGEYAVAFVMYPTSMKEVMKIADAGKIMSPKSTWFEPKLRDGLVVHTI